MSIQKVNHSVWQPLVNQSIAKGSASTTTEWWDINGWTDKAVTYEQDVTGSASLTITMDVSPKGYYELNNSATALTTDDFQTLTIVSSGSAKIMTRVDSSDLDDLQRPIRSARFKVVNGQASNAATVNLWLEGWS